MARVAPEQRGVLGLAATLGVLAVLVGTVYATSGTPAERAPITATAAPTVTAAPEPRPTVTPSWVAPVDVPSPAASAPGFSKHTYVVHVPASPWVVVNKLRPLQPQDYVPPELVTLAAVPGGGDQWLIPEAAAAFTELYSAADAAGASFRVSTAYRSYNQQLGIYNSYVANWGKARAETFVARAGYSEHQTGRAVDIYTTAACKLKACFADTAAAQWVAAHAHEYGFIVRYPPDKQAITGYQYEPWHLRYVGAELASQMHATGPHTMEEFFGLPAATDYAD